jgi:hypothetical protein
MQLYERSSVFFSLSVGTKPGVTLHRNDVKQDTCELQAYKIKTSIRHHLRLWEWSAFGSTHHMWMCIGRIDKDPSAINLRSKWKWVVSYTLRLFYFQEES